MLINISNLSDCTVKLESIPSKGFQISSPWDKRLGGDYDACRLHLYSIRFSMRV